MDDIREIVEAVVREFMPQKDALEEERRRREGLELRVSELMAETEKARTQIEAEVIFDLETQNAQHTKTLISALGRSRVKYRVES